MILTFMALAAVLTGRADDYTYLTFEMTDGGKTSVPAEELEITLDGTTLTAGGQTFALTNLSKMYFTLADETTGIDTVGMTDDEAIEFYDLNGRKINREQLPSQGVYIAKAQNGTYKMMSR